jgi:hypothetical protein
MQMIHGASISEDKKPDEDLFRWKEKHLLRKAVDRR